jgi:hypothetical protein
MATDVADLVLLEDGHPVILVDAKRSPAPPEFRSAVAARLQDLTTRLNSSWSLLVDPETARVYRGDNLEDPVATIPTERIVRDASPPDFAVIGQRTLLQAIERWLQRLTVESSLVDSYPALHDLAQDIARTEEWIRDYALECQRGGRIELDHRHSVW